VIENNSFAAQKPPVSTLVIEDVPISSLPQKQEAVGRRPPPLKFEGPASSGGAQPVKLLLILFPG